MNAYIKECTENYILLGWNVSEGAKSYAVYYADSNTSTTKYKKLGTSVWNEFEVHISTHIPYYFKIEALWDDGKPIETSNVIKTPVKKHFDEQLEALNRGIIAAKCDQGIFIGWRLFRSEVTGYCDTGMTGTDFVIYKNGKRLDVVTNSTNYIDKDGTVDDLYSVAAVVKGEEAPACEGVKAFKSGEDYLEIPMLIPAGGTTPAGENYTYTVNDMSIGDVDGDQELEFIVKWDPTNSKDVSQRGYTGNCILDCYKMSGQILWRIDMGINIRAGAHYTQFMVYDFDNDGKAEMAVKTAPGTKMHFFNDKGNVTHTEYITIPEEDAAKGITHFDDYRMSAEGYYHSILRLFTNWQSHPEVVKGNWPSTIEECLGLDNKYSYPLSEENARSLADYFIDEFAPNKSSMNKLRQFEGFIVDGPEYLTMFSGDGKEIETIPFKYQRVDDGLLWGDYALPRIEPANRVDRFLSTVAYLDGERPYLIICRGYYTRVTMVAYSFFDRKFEEKWSLDSGFVPMKNPFRDNPHMEMGTDPQYGILAGQGNHSLSVADVDQDGCQEIIFGAAVIDHDGSVLYSSYGYLPDGTYCKFGHGDAMHVAKIDPDLPGLQIYNVFEAGEYAPYGFAMRDAATGEVIFGEHANKDLGRCMIGDICPGIRGLQMWVYQTQDVEGRILDVPVIGTNQSIRWAADLTTQILDGNDIFSTHSGVVNDITHGIMLNPKGMATNNGTKGNPCLVADIFGDFREELILRKADNTAIRIYTNTDLTKHKLFTLLHDIMYRVGIAWQNNCYNQPCYTKFYLASDMDFKYVLPEMDFE